MTGSNDNNPSNDYRHNRREYAADGLRRAHLDDDPVEQFALWLADADRAGVVDVTAMTLATVGQASEGDPQPNARIVLLKHFDQDGFVWYTDYTSRKGEELAQHARAALLFHWREMDRQVRIVGRVSKIEDAASAAYFASRPLDSQRSAAASNQSQPINSRAALEAQVSELTDVTRPARWGGHRLVPEQVEFWH